MPLPSCFAKSLTNEAAIACPAVVDGEKIKNGVKKGIIFKKIKRISRIDTEYIK